MLYHDPSLTQFEHVLGNKYLTKNTDHFTRKLNYVTNNYLLMQHAQCSFQYIVIYVTEVYLKVPFIS